MLHRSAMFLPLIFDERAPSLRRVPPHSGHGAKVAIFCTNARMCGCRESTSLDSIDFWIFGMRPSYVRLSFATLTFVGSLYRKSSSSCLVYFLIGLSASTNPDSANWRTAHPSAV